MGAIADRPIYAGGCLILKMSRNLLIPILAALLIGGIAGDAWTMRKPDRADAYHARIKRVADAIPMRMNSWLGEDVPIEAEAVALLKPNVVISRRFVDSVSGLGARFLLVQCADARDMVAHYPPICYAARGWNSISSQPRDWLVKGLNVTGMEYRFESPSIGESRSVVIADFMIMPDGRIMRNMGAIEKASVDISLRFLGAAQIQVSFDPSVPRETRDAAIVSLLGHFKPVIDEIRRGEVE
jgi:hypothetical protein